MEKKLIRNASIISLVVGVSLMLFKFWAFSLTKSEAVLSDALESIVNVVTAALAIVVVIVSAKPADKDHPYGHGKAEFVSAAFEGGLIAFAALAIIFEAVKALIHREQIGNLGFGSLLVFGAGVANFLLGVFLVRIGRKHNSAALVASGTHVMSDFVTSTGVLIGLGLVSLTGFTWIDPLCAIIVACLLAYTGYKLVRESLGGLLDEEDQEIIQAILRLIGNDRPAGIIQIHHLRVMRAGHYHHIDAHAVVPEYWDVREAHNYTDAFEEALMEHYPYDGELHLHLDPCRRAYCRYCDVVECPIRREPFVEKLKIEFHELTSPLEPKRFRKKFQQSRDAVKS